MDNGLYRSEEKLKAEAMRAVESGDWPEVHRCATALVAVYDEILSTLFEPAVRGNWEWLRTTWMDYARRSKALMPKASPLEAPSDIAETANKLGTNPVDTHTPDAVHAARVLGLDLSKPTAKSRSSQMTDANKNERADQEGTNNDLGDDESGPGTIVMPGSMGKNAIKLDDVKGLKEAKAIVMDALINPIKHPDIFSTLKIKPGTGLLLYGPPGTGKTMFAKAIANEMNMPFMHVKLDDLKSKYVGDSERNIAAMFRRARSFKKCVLFLDECESLLRKRGNQKVCMVEQFLVELDGFSKDEQSQLFILLATNRPWLIDSAITRSGRVSAAVYVDLPDMETRRIIVEDALKGVPLSPDVDIDQLALKTDGYSGAEICHREKGGGVCDEARKFAGRRWMDRRKNQKEGSSEWARAEAVTWSDFEQAFKTVVPTSVRDKELIAKNKRFSIGHVSGDDKSGDGEEEE